MRILFPFSDDRSTVCKSDLVGIVVIGSDSLRLPNPDPNTTKEVRAKARTSF
ncbi:MAG: hypothetical protein RLZ37_1245, partial [Actinomycetota bacterium]